MTLEAGSDAGWRSRERLAVGRALLAAEPAAMTARELAEAVGKNQSNVRRTANAMVDADLLVAEQAPLRHTGSGRQPKVVYRLADAERRRLRTILDARNDLGTLAEGLEVVLADASGARLPALLAVMTEPEAAPQLAWSALVDGEPQEYLFAFEGPGARSGATSLVAVLAAADIPSRRASIAGVVAGHRFLAEARQATTAATRVAIRQATRRAATG